VTVAPQVAAHILIAALQARWFCQSDMWNPLLHFEYSVVQRAEHCLSDFEKSILGSETQPARAKAAAKVIKVFM
jgi:hypothetical protein